MSVATAKAMAVSPDGTAFTVLVRGGDGQYAEAAASHALPTMPLDELARRLRSRNVGDQMTWLREWQEWLRANP